MPIPANASPNRRSRTSHSDGTPNCSLNAAPSGKAAPARKALLTAFIGGVPFPDAPKESDFRLAEIAHAEISSRLGIRAKPEEVFVRKWMNAIPQLNRGYSDLRHTVSTFSSHNPISVVGSAITGLSLNDCAGAGRAEGERLAATLSRTILTLPQEEPLCQLA